jgi:flagellin-like protein
MELKQLLTDERAVSPVIGVILMVAITVILAAVIGTFVLGLGQNVQSTPQASFDFDFEQDADPSVAVTHNGGDTLEIGDNTNSVEIVSGDGEDTPWVNTSSGGSVAAGDTRTHNYTTNGTTVRVVWTGPNNESSATLGSQESPT